METKGETADGGKFGRMNKTMCRYAKTRSSQMAEYGANMKDVDMIVRRCAAYVTALSDGMNEQQRHEFAHLFNLANIGRYYILVMLKETADVLLDAGLIEPGSDPWFLGGSAGGR